LKKKIVFEERYSVVQYQLVGHLNGFFAPREGNLNKPIFKSSNGLGVAPGGMLNFQIDRRITFWTLLFLVFWG